MPIGGQRVGGLDRLRLFEKTLLPLVLMGAIFAVTIGLGGTVLHQTVESYREILSRNAPAVLRIERLNALTDQVGYATARNLAHRCPADGAACVSTERDVNAAATEGEQRLDEAVRFDPEHRADYERFRLAFRAIVQSTRTAIALGNSNQAEKAKALMAPVHGRIIALSDDIYRYSNLRTSENRAQGLALAARVNDTERNMIVVSVIAAILGLAVAAWIGFAELTDPVMRLCREMARLALGDLDTPIDGQNRRDEIGMMARAVQVFKENALARIKAEEDAEQARTAAAQTKRDALAEIARVARVLTVGELASSIAHEINQPIGAIATNGQTALRWLQREPADIDKAKAATERTVRDAERAAAVVARVRAMLAKSDPEFAPLDMNRVIEDVLGFIDDERRRAEVQVRTKLAPDLPRVLGDPIQLQQVALNLVMNGIEAMRANPARARILCVTTSAEPDGVKVTVEDRGSGLDPEVIDRVFEPFFTTKTSGIGLGLAITRSIVEAHGGRIWAEAASPSGASFQFTLPAAKANAHA